MSILKYKPLITTLLMAIGALSAVAQPDSIIIPKPVVPGSRIAIVSPASSVKDKVLDDAVAKLTELGFQPVVFPHAYGKEYGSYPATDERRASDLMTAFADPDIDAVLCARGGYGTVRLLPMLDAEVIRANPKWLIGYSDISALHAFMHHAGVASIHGPMCSHIGSEPDSLLATQYLFKVMADSFPLAYNLPPEDFNKYGSAKGRLLGGNLTVVDGLGETPYDVLNIGDKEDVILFIEDIGEEIYRVERMLMRLHYSGALAKVKGIIVGQFTDYKRKDDFESMELMIHYWLNKWGYYDDGVEMPIAFNFPVGHVTDNYPMVVSAEVTLDVTPEGTTMTYTGK